MSLTLHRECGVSIVKSLLFNDHSRDQFRYRRIQIKRPSQSAVMPCGSRVYHVFATNDLATPLVAVEVGIILGARQAVHRHLFWRAARKV